MYTLSDTVGFVRHLPHQLVDAFRSTLKEVAHADLVVHVVDSCAPDALVQVTAVRGVLYEIGAAQLPELLVLNKVDCADLHALAALRRALPPRVDRLRQDRRGPGRVARGHHARARLVRDPGRRCRVPGRGSAVERGGGKGGRPRLVTSTLRSVARAQVAATADSCAPVLLRGRGRCFQ